MFAEVFKHHSDEEIEECLTIGVSNNVSKIEKVETEYPQPWLFSRAFLGSGILYLLFLFGWLQFQNIYLIPGLIIVGSFTIPLATLVFFFELNIRKNISLYQVAKLFFAGGTLAILSSLFLFSIVDGFGLDVLGASIAGVIEEPGKLMALILVANNKKYPYILNGLLFGAAIGAGFAAFESAGYAFSIFLGSFYESLQEHYFDLAWISNAMLENITIRGLLAPFSHIVWTSISSAAIWKIKRNNKFKASMLNQSTFMKVFMASVILHMLWNSGFRLLGIDWLMQIAIGLVGWSIVFGIVNEGLVQIKRIKYPRAAYLKNKQRRDELTKKQSQDT
ncbi:PrsW family intramembrane metalloprotease [[Leptolyngbya] sp. PCC 7376]|uniref:PrsW family intramembrane metalloprotease n=1 Tax=[Leptolyngbya] sp. PCC 7376 TaxID=111781 RepID=UPI001359C80B|nr:PrsW family glutamic-type intramembrane protease [[Leptolyngbya] sp. PCC 7376]